MPRYIFLLIFTILCSSLAAQEDSYKFRIYLTDKGTTSFQTDKPEEFLSRRAIERRIRQHIAVDSSDLPISDEYIKIIKAQGCIVVAKSNWLSTISVHCEDSTVVEDIKKLDFVRDVVCVWKGKILPEELKKGKEKKKETSGFADYGKAYSQIKIHKGDSLHNAGYRGEGMEIAVIDAGFYDFLENPVLKDIKIKGTKDFVYAGRNMFESSTHGMNVLSTMAANVPGTYIGTAPEASYWLLRSEDTRTEFPIEEDYWVTAAEYADSVGVDIINSSLGYNIFSAPAISYTYQQMDGKTAYITKGADIAVSKGIFVVSSTGNEGNKKWEKIVAPGDGINVFTVGAVKSDSLIAGFSSRGPTADGRIKPDVVGVGANTALVGWGGEVHEGNGTSFSAPVVCGLIACLWQAFPDLTNKQIADAVRKSANRYSYPDDEYGYGIPDMVKAMEIAKTYTGIKNSSEISLQENCILTLDSTGITVIKYFDDNESCRVELFDIDGKILQSDVFTEKEKHYDIDRFSQNIYIIRLTYKNVIKSHKVIL